MGDGNLGGERLGVRGVRRDFGDETVDVDFPAVKDAAQSAILIAGEYERAAAVRTALGEKPDAAVGRAEGNVIGAEKADAHRGTVGHQLGRQDGRYPVVPHQPPHWGVALNPGQPLVLLVSQHVTPPGRPLWAVSFLTLSDTAK